VKFNVLFERFLSEGRKGWPDIDMDLPSGTARTGIQEVYRRYGPRGAAMTGTVITYGGRSSSREIGKVLNLRRTCSDRFRICSATAIFAHVDLTAQLDKAGLPRFASPRAPAFIAPLSADGA